MGQQPRSALVWLDKCFFWCGCIIYFTCWFAISKTTLIFIHCWLSKFIYHAQILEFLEFASVLDELLHEVPFYHAKIRDVISVLNNVIISTIWQHLQVQGSPSFYPIYEPVLGWLLRHMFSDWEQIVCGKLMDNALPRLAMTLKI